MSETPDLAGSQLQSPLTKPYWDGLASRELLLQCCNDCKKFQHYPRLICRHCSSESLTFAATSGRGTVFAATLVHRANAARANARLPYWLALVRLEEGPLLFALLIDVPDAQPTSKRGSGLQGTDVHIDWDATSHAGLLTARPRYREVERH